MDLYGSASETSLSILCIRGFELTRSKFIMFTLLYVNPEVSVCKIWKFRVHLLPCSNLKVPDLLNWKFRVWQAVNFIRCLGVKIL
jgi:hypothetical protein